MCVPTMLAVSSQTAIEAEIKKANIQHNFEQALEYAPGMQRKECLSVFIVPIVFPNGDRFRNTAFARAHINVFQTVP
jgi:hypothetical protein